MVRAESNELRARAWILDERDHAILHSLVVHKVLTTDRSPLPEAPPRGERGDETEIFQLLTSAQALRPAFVRIRQASEPRTCRGSSPRSPEPTTDTASLRCSPSTGSAGGRRGQARRVRTVPAPRRGLRVLPGVRPGHRGVRRALAKARGLPAARGGGDGGPGSQRVSEPPPGRPEGVREGEVGSALRHAIGSLHVRASLASSFPLYVAGEDRLRECGVLGPAWRHLVTDRERVTLVDLPSGAGDLYRSTRCLGRYWTDDDVGLRGRIAPASSPPRFPVLTQGGNR